MNSISFSHFKDFRMPFGKRSYISQTQYDNYVYLLEQCELEAEKIKRSMVLVTIEQPDANINADQSTPKLIECVKSECQFIPSLN